MGNPETFEADGLLEKEIEETLQNRQRMRDGGYDPEPDFPLWPLIVKACPFRISEKTARKLIDIVSSDERFRAARIVYDMGLDEFEAVMEQIIDG